MFGGGLLFLGILYWSVNYAKLSVRTAFWAGIFPPGAALSYSFRLFALSLFLWVVSLAFFPPFYFVTYAAAIGIKSPVYREQAFEYARRFHLG